MNSWIIIALASIVATGYIKAKPLFIKEASTPKDTFRIDTQLTYCRIGK